MKEFVEIALCVIIFGGLLYAAFAIAWAFLRPAFAMIATVVTMLAGGGI